ncbi:MAG TPA: hypothetical protein VN524_07095 [Hyphomicrobiaceae bacterium]|nr:hypothetical protein [Hyphomicrobiaceae bacterium]
MPSTALSTAVYAPIEPIPHRDRRRAGQPTPDGWPQVFIAKLTEHGKGWKAAKQAGVSYDTVQRLRALDAQFRTDEADAMREFTESLEDNLDRIASGADMPAVTANIVRLKKLDPVGYVERNLQITASFTTELPSQDGKILLLAMLGQPTGELTTPAIEVAHASADATPTRATP